MPWRPFRFLHAADLRLDQPVHGLAELPEHLRALLIDAPYRAAARVFDGALAEDAAFVVISGGLLRAEYAGPRGPLFLAEQFARLAVRRIPVYCVGNTADPVRDWPAFAPLPANVRFFSAGRAEEVLIERDGMPLARVFGASDDGHPPRLAQFTPDATGLFTAGVLCGEFAPAALDARGISYWALGGRGERASLFVAPRMAHYPGTPQGRSPDEAGAHGYTLVQVDEQGHPRLHPMDSDALRWCDERVLIDDHTTPEGLRLRLHARSAELLASAPSVQLLVRWRIAGDGPLGVQLRRGALASELRDGLRAEFGFAVQGLWTAEVQLEPSAALPAEWYEQQSIRGDYLRALRRLEMNPDEPVGVGAYLAERHRELAAAVEPRGPARKRVLHAAAGLGVDLLTGEDAK